MKKKRQYIQGRYTLINPNKYTGDKSEIIYRSSWEKRFFLWADLNTAVVSWSSEETVIPYVCETDNRVHRYFMDVKITIKNSNGDLNTYLVEIKPFSQTQPPKYPGKQTKRYLTEVETFVKNQSKWKAAKSYAADRGMQFIILTENELGIGNGSKVSSRKNTRQKPR